MGGGVGLGQQVVPPQLGDLHGRGDVVPLRAVVELHDAAALGHQLRGHEDGPRGVAGAPVRAGLHRGAGEESFGDVWRDLLDPHLGVVLDGVSFHVDAVQPLGQAVP